jgi:hypothetical protein
MTLGHNCNCIELGREEKRLIPHKLVNLKVILASDTFMQFADKPRPIKPTGDCLYPTLTMMDASIEANFGDNPANPFKYDLDKCPGLRNWSLSEMIRYKFEETFF